MTRDSSPQFFLEAMTAKIMHDLMTPASALSSGVELLEGNIAPANEIVPLLRESVDKLLGTLMLFRSSWGKNSTTTRGKSGETQETRRLLTDFIAMRKHRLTHCEMPEMLGVSMQRILLAALYLLNDVLLPGGEIQVLCTEAQLQITLVGKITKSAADLAAAFDGPLTAADTQTVLWAATQEMIRDASCVMTLTDIEDGLILVLSN